MKKILILTPRYPYPIAGGDKLRIHNIAKELSKKYKITLLSLVQNKNEEKKCPPPKEIYNEYYTIHLPKYKSCTNALWALTKGESLQTAYYKSNKFQKKTNELIKQHDFAYAHLIRTAPYLIDQPIKKGLEMTDALSLCYQRARINKKSIKSLIYFIEEKRIKKLEKQMPDKFDFTTLVSETDKQFLFGEKNKNIIVATNGTDLKDAVYNIKNTTPNKATVIFIGNMTTLQNIDAAKYFQKEVMPLLNKENNNFKFIIMGIMDAKLRKQFNKNENTYATGKVENIKEEIKKIIRLNEIHDELLIVSAAPIRIGAGIQNKVLESMSMGIPTIITEVAAEGLKAISNKDYLPANTPQQFQQQIEYLSRNPKRAKEIAENARKYVLDNHSWDHCLKDLSNKIDEIINQ